MFSALFDGVIRDEERFCMLRRQSLENKKIKAIPHAKFHMIHTRENESCGMLQKQYAKQ